MKTLIALCLCAYLAGTKAVNLSNSDLCSTKGECVACICDTYDAQVPLGHPKSCGITSGVFRVCRKGPQPVGKQRFGACKTSPDCVQKCVSNYIHHKASGRCLGGYHHTVAGSSCETLASIYKGKGHYCKGPASVQFGADVTNDCCALTYQSPSPSPSASPSPSPSTSSAYNYIYYWASPSSSSVSPTASSTSAYDYYYASSSSSTTPAPVPPFCDTDEDCVKIICEHLTGTFGQCHSNAYSTGHSFSKQAHAACKRTGLGVTLGFQACRHDAACSTSCVSNLVARQIARCLRPTDVDDCPTKARFFKAFGYRKCPGAHAFNMFVDKVDASCQAKDGVYHVPY